MDTPKISRSIAACTRCRQKKIKCSHHFPKCTACWKAGVECLSLDPTTGRKIPRSYIVHLESRIEDLENQLKDIQSSAQNHNQYQIPATSNKHQANSTLQHNVSNIPHQLQETSNLNHLLTSNITTPSSVGISPNNIKNNITSIDSNITNPSNDKNEPLLSFHNYNSVKSSNDDSSRPTTFSGSGISFSKLMFAAVHFKDASDSSNKNKKRRRSSSNIQNSTNKPPIDPTTCSMSSFSNHVALLPPKQQALDFVALYFAQSNSQLPIFHRENFINNYFIPIYGDIPENSFFASINKSIDLSKLIKIKEEDTWYYKYTRLLDSETGVNPDMNPFEFSARVTVPKKFKKALYFVNIVFAVASSVWHLQFPNEISDNFKNAALAHIEEVYSSINRLESLQAMLCLTLYSLMRPCVPGVWYLLGSSLRLCVDLGLHSESNLSPTTPFILDMRRRLFWCCYSLDRQICVYLGRPFGIPEESINVPFPSLLDDSEIDNDSKLSILYPKETDLLPSYKNISITMFKIRQLQAEIQSILYENRELPRKFTSLTSWLIDMSLRLDIWRSNTPKNVTIMNCNFTIEFFDLNYYHARIMLHGLTPLRYILTSNDFISVADASKGMLLIFYSLCKRGALNYTWAVTQNVFMAQMSFLYAVFHSDVVKNATPLEEIKKLTAYANLVLNSLIDRCNAAGQCLEVLTILSQAVVRLKYSNESRKANNNDNIGKENNNSKNGNGNEDGNEDGKDNENENDNDNHIDNEDEDELTSCEIKKIPSEDEVKTLQPGGHMTGNMRRLIVSIPELINGDKIINSESENNDNNNNEANSNDDKNKNIIKIEDANSPMDKPTPSSAAGSSELNTDEDLNSIEGVVDGIWKINESELQRFFEHVNKVESPASVKSSRQVSSENMPLAFTSTNGARSSFENQGLSSNSLDINAQQMLSPNQRIPPYTISNDQIQHSTNDPLSNSRPLSSLQHSLFTGAPLLPNLNNNLQPFQTAPLTPPNILPGFSQSFTPKNQLSESPDSIYPETKRRKSKEGQRVYRLMLETGTESIWDQFFAQPF